MGQEQQKLTSTGAISANEYCRLQVAINKLCAQLNASESLSLDIKVQVTEEQYNNIYALDMGNGIIIDVTISKKRQLG